MSDTLILEPSRAGHVAKGRKEYKDEQLFARLIGAAVLLALAVIVLPFVLDGSGSQREYEYAETLPPEPAVPVVEKSFSSRQPVPAPAAESVNVRVPETTSLAGLEVAQTPAAGTTGLDSGEVAVNPLTPNNNATQGQISGATVLELSPIPLGWNIQVASFVREANAVKLVNRLRNQNLAAYANLVKGKKRSVIRVLVGPYSNQVDALALQNRVDREYQVESIIVRGK